MENREIGENNPFLGDVSQETLAQAVRAMRCEKWSISDGVLDIRGTRFKNLPDMAGFNIVIAFPDFRDELTLGRLKELTRAAHQDPELSPTKVLPGVWRITVNNGGSKVTVEEPTEADAYLYALENV
jgi:hypothetical protein